MKRDSIERIELDELLNELVNDLQLGKLNGMIGDISQDS